LVVVYVSDPNLSDGGRIIGLRTTVGSGEDAVTRLGARIEERLDFVHSPTAPPQDDALAGLLTAVAAVTEASVLLATLLCVSDGAGTRCHLLGAAELRHLVSSGQWRSDAMLISAGQGRLVDLGPWLRAWREAAREQAARETAVTRLMDELRTQLADELRSRIEQEEGPKIEQALREELEPIVRREIECRLRRHPGAGS
jgi:hypothetical protein